MISERNINKFLNGRQFFILTAVLLMVLSWVAIDGKIQASFLSWGLNVVSIVGVGVLLSFLNKSYSIIRSVTYISSSTYMLLGVMCPDISTQWHDGTLLSLVAVVLAGLLFGIYQSRFPQRRVYLISVILSAIMMYRFEFVYLIPVFFIGFLQMRAMSVRSALAMLFGLLTPFWIALGIEMISFSDFQLFYPDYIQSDFDVTESGFIVIVAAVTAFITLVLLLRNLLQIINYKMQIRAYNGFFLVLTLLTMVVMAVDYGNILVYLPVLNICLAIQMGHAFTIKKYLRRYILYLLFVVLCISVYVWHVFY